MFDEPALVALGGVIAAATAIFSFVWMGRRVGIIPDPEKQAEMSRNLDEALRAATRALNRIDAHEKTCTERYELLREDIASVRETMAEMRGEMKSWRSGK